MVLRNSIKGKRRIVDSPSESSSSLSPAPPEYPPIKKPKRAETRICPVCDEDIPLRLLGTHSVLEQQRVDAIVKCIGSTEILQDDAEAGPSSRRSAQKARKSLSAMNPRANLTDTLELSNKTIQTIKRRRKQRHGKLRDMAREEEEGIKEARASGSTAEEIVCPVCLNMVRGDEDVVEAHIDACLADESRRIEEEREREVTVGGSGDAIGIVSGMRGAGFHVRDRNQEDIDDEVDVDGDDEAVFGDAQFTEGDILDPIFGQSHPFDEDFDVEVDGNDEAQREQKTLRDLVAEGKVVRKKSPREGVEAVKAKMDEVMGIGDADIMDLAILAARRQRDPRSIIFALENKIKQLETMRISSLTSLLCRICLDPYTEPTASTGCWHTYCRECWLRCLGSTKLCPICKRITAATDLRRIYL